MRKLAHRLFTFSLLISILCLSQSTGLAKDFKREVIYQIITDRFFDVSTANNNPLKIAAASSVTWENGANHSYTVWRCLYHKPGVPLRFTPGFTLSPSAQAGSSCETWRTE